MTKAEFEAWVKTLRPRSAREAEGFFTVIRRDAERSSPPCPTARSTASRSGARRRPAARGRRADRQRVAEEFLHLRADAFLSDDYYASDVAWMDLDAPLDITIGPYETYNDELFGYKAAFEAYVTLRDDAETAQARDVRRAACRRSRTTCRIDPQLRTRSSARWRPSAS